MSPPTDLLAGMEALVEVWRGHLEKYPNNTGDQFSRHAGFNAALAECAKQLEQELGKAKGIPARARCLYCGKRKPVTRSGRFRKHWTAGGPSAAAPGQREICGGSGRPA